MAKKKGTDSKKSAALAKAAKKAKAAAKLEKRETKKASKSKKDADDEDLEAILENMRKEWEEKHKVTEEIVEGPPSRRANATLTACPSGNYLWCIGGEFFSEDGKAYFYNDVYRYTPDKNEWRKFVSQTCPGPRSAHAVVASPAGGGKLFLFGGEFSSLHQNSFHHYRDFWVFDITMHTWDRIETKIRPSARSGCRLALWKHFIFLFGGFVDPGIRTNYLNDLWYFDTQEYHWRQIEIREGERKPSPRSGFSFLPTADGIILHGGYCKEYAKGKRPIGIMLEDTWFLRLTLNESPAPGSVPAPKPSTKPGGNTHPFVAKWERRKKIGYTPGLRSGCTMALWTTRGTGVLFGGVTDEDTNEETLESVFHNDLYGYQIAGNGRWQSLVLRKPKKNKATGKKAKQMPVRTSRGPDLDEDEDGGEYGDSDSGAENASSAKPKLPVQTSTKLAPLPYGDEIDPDDPILTIPRARYNSMLAVLRNTLYIYGGILELGPREYTLDDFYSLALDKLDRYICLKPCDVVLPKEGEEIDSSEDDDDDDDGDDDDDDDSDEDNEEDVENTETGDKNEERDNIAEQESMVRDKTGTKITDSEEEESGADEDSETKGEMDIRARAQAFLGTGTSNGKEAGPQQAIQSAEDALSTPLPGETLAAFYSRTREYWAGKAHGASTNRGKMLRRDGFALAQERYAEYKPILEEVEKILAEAGLDEEEIRRSGAAGGIGGAKGPQRERGR